MDALKYKGFNVKQFVGSNGQLFTGNHGRHVCVYDPHLYFLYENGKVVVPELTHQFFTAPFKNWKELDPENFLVPMRVTGESIKTCTCSSFSLVHFGHEVNCPEKR